MSRYEQILAAVEAAVGQISIAGGYNTDAGLRVYRNLEYQSAEATRPFIAVHPGETTDSLTGETPPSLGEENHSLSLTIEGVTDDSERGESAEALRQDLLRALKIDPFFGGLAEGFDRITSKASVEDGGEEGFVGVAAVHLNLQYVTLWRES